jgi:hypothetical protein
MRERHRNQPFQRITSVLILMVAAVGCAGPDARTSTPLNAAARQQIYQRASEPMTKVALFKPRTDAHPDYIYLAPLLFHPLTTQTEFPALSFYTNAISIYGHSLKQLTWFWRPSTPASGKAVSDHQGVRMTFAPSGKPVLWEVLSDRTGAELIFVSQELEMAAAREFGPAPTGRVCSIERPLSEANRTIVPTVVDDGPVPMGPMVYLNGGEDIAIVACRCSEAQAEELSAQGTYRFREVTLETARKVLPAEWFEPRRLDKALRLPPFP